MGTLRVRRRLSLLAGTALALGVLVPASPAEARLVPGCQLRGTFHFTVDPLGNAHRVRMELMSNQCSVRGQQTTVWFSASGTAGSLGKCSGETLIRDVQMTGVFAHSRDGVQPDEEIPMTGAMYFPGHLVFAGFDPYGFAPLPPPQDGVEFPSAQPMQFAFDETDGPFDLAVDLEFALSTRIYGNCDPGGSPAAVAVITNSKYPASG